MLKEELIKTITIMKKEFLIALLFTFGTSALFAQDTEPKEDEAVAIATSVGVNCENGWCWGEDPGVTKEKYALFNDSYKMKDYVNALEPYEWLLENVPYLNKGIYIKGVSMYKALLKKESDAAKKIELQDKILMLHDERIKYYGEVANVKARKGALAYTYLSKREDKDYKPELYDLYNEILELNGNETSRSNLTFLMVIAVNMKVKKVIDEDGLMSKYEEISEVIDHNIANTTGDNKAKWEKTQDSINGYLVKGINITCDFVREKMGDDIKNNPTDVKLMKRAIKYMLTAKCLDDELFIIAAKSLFEAEPDLGLAKIISNDFLKQEEYDNAITWKEKAIELASEDPTNKADLTLDIAKIESKLGKKSAARSRALKAIEYDNAVAGQAYSMIGNLYMSSGKQCFDADPVKSRGCYLAAYDMYAKAGDNAGMARARAQFPSISDIFTKGMKEGDSIDVGCWIGGSTVLRKRPSE